MNCSFVFVYDLPLSYLYHSYSQLKASEFDYDAVDEMTTMMVCEDEIEMYNVRKDIDYVGYQLENDIVMLMMNDDQAMVVDIVL